MYKFKEDNMIVPCYVWAEQGGIEQGAIDQIKNASSLPFVFHHTVLCPDAHQGYGVSIGSVVALKNAISPMMVGVDIGCGMCAVKTTLTEIKKETLEKIVEEIKKVIPVGFNKHKETQNDILMPKVEFKNIEECMNWGDSVVESEYKNALKSLGTMGQNNHFIEIQKGNDGHIWIMIHSGSRNLGKQVADHYNNLAIKLNQKWHSNSDKKLAFLPVDSEKGQDYIKEMNYCVEFAFANRKLMMDRIKDIFRKIFNEPVGEETPTLFDGEMINIAHNYARLENHFGQDVWVHRKGATSAKEGEIGIIPGSQGTKSYIVKGLGNKESFKSCSHGAGRLLGRGVAQRTLNLEEEQRKLDEQGIIHGIKTQKDLDEATSCYKDIDVVMENQKDLVEILVELKTLAVIKG